MILEITTPFQCFGELLVMALEIDLELTIHFHHIEMNHFHHEFHLLLAQIWVVGFAPELDCCQLLLLVAVRHCRSEVRHYRRCCISWFWSSGNLRILLYSGLDFLWSNITNSH